MTGALGGVAEVGRRGGVRTSLVDEALANDCSMDGPGLVFVGGATATEGLVGFMELLKALACGGW